MSTAQFNTWQNTDGTENYKCRAWVNFNGTGTVAIRASGNVSSITDTANGTYSVNFTNALPDGNYVIGGCMDNTNGNAYILKNQSVTNTASTAYVFSATYNDSVDSVFCTVQFFR